MLTIKKFIKNQFVNIYIYIIYMEINFSEENFQDEIPSNQRPKIIKKTQLGKRTVLSSNKNKLKLGENNLIQNFEQKSEENDEDNKEEIIIIKDETTPLNKNQKDNSSDFLIKTILKAYYLSIWKKKIKSLKYYSRGANKQRSNFKKFINQISSTIKQHKYEYFNELYENMKNLPTPKNVKHDANFGTIRIINKDVLFRKYTNKIATWSDDKYSQKINGFKIYLIEAFKKMNDNKGKYEQTNSSLVKGDEFNDYEDYQNTQVINKDRDNNLQNENQVDRNMDELNYYKESINNNEVDDEKQNNLKPKINNVKQYTINIIKIYKN